MFMKEKHSREAGERWVNDIKRVNDTTERLRRYILWSFKVDHSERLTAEVALTWMAGKPLHPNAPRRRARTIGRVTTKCGPSRTSTLKSVVNEGNLPLLWP